MQRKVLQSMWGILFPAFTLCAANLSNPLTPIPAARLGVGISYHLGGYTITADSIPALMNRIDACITFSPLDYVNIGLDAGVTSMDVAAVYSSQDTLPLFHGNFGFSAGGRIKLSTPLFIEEFLGGVFITRATWFSSSNKAGAMYSGIDGTAAAGLLLHIPKFGYLAAGPQVYLIDGRNRSYNSDTEQSYANLNNLRGWVALDYFPKLESISETNLYVSVELSIGPDVRFSGPSPLEGMSVSVSLGGITKRLYGQTAGTEWTP